MCCATASQNDLPKMKRDMNFPKSTVETRQPACRRRRRLACWVAPPPISQRPFFFQIFFSPFLPSPFPPVILCRATASHCTII